MDDSTFRLIAARTAFATVLTLACLVGCSPEVVGVGEDDHEAEHHVPPHFPPNAVAGIARLRELLEPGSSASPSADVTPRQEVLDLARWLPELAAETELDEKDWNRVRDASRTLERAAREATGDAPPSGPKVVDALAVLAEIPKAVVDAEIADRRERGLDVPSELAVDAPEESPSPEDPES